VHALLSNAADHVEPGATISVRARAESGALVLTIANRIARQGRHDGLGVGMYLSGRLAEQLGATLTTENTGDEFRVALQLPSCRRDYDTSM
jgi:signal transduction histidine kinase